MPDWQRTSWSATCKVLLTAQRCPSKISQCWFSYIALDMCMRIHTRKRLGGGSHAAAGAGAARRGEGLLPALAPIGEPPRRLGQAGHYHPRPRPLLARQGQRAGALVDYTQHCTLLSVLARLAAWWGQTTVTAHRSSPFSSASSSHNHT